MKKESFFSHFQGNFFTGLAIVLPAVVSVLLLYWGYDTVAKITDSLLFFLPREWTHQANANGPGLGRMWWYWSLASLIVTIILIALIGQLGRYYFGRQILHWADHGLMQIPLLNKIYSTVKQVNDAFSSNKSSFKQVVMVSFPHPGAKSIGFVTGEHKAFSSDGEVLFSVFIPTTPNPTSGFMILLPERDLVKLDMTVAEGIKFIISLGSIAPNILTQQTPSSLPAPSSPSSQSSPTSTTLPPK